MAGFADSAVVELRRYLLHPGRFDDLRDVFERWLVAGQERAGMRMGRRFRDRDNPDRFVWLRGFASMAQRKTALETFYYGPLWREHAAAANDTMIDSDDVLLLRPTDPPHPPPPDGGPAWGLGQVWSADRCPSVEQAHAVLARVLETPVAMWRTEPGPNTFPRLPVREGEYVVWLATFADEHRWAKAEDRIAADADRPELRAAGSPLEWMRLLPSG
jgi:hypothetical protein